VNPTESEPAQSASAAPDVRRDAPRQVPQLSVAQQALLPPVSAESMLPTVEMAS